MTVRIIHLFSFVSSISLYTYILLIATASERKIVSQKVYLFAL